MDSMDLIPRIDWPNGDCYPVMASKVLPEELARRSGSNSFRARDDLDWFVGIVILSSAIGPILVMRHDNNPENLTAFYVDVSVNADWARMIIAETFSLAQSEISWVRPA